MNYQPGDTFYAVGFTNGTSGAQDADSNPTGLLIHNGSPDVSVSISVVKLQTGVYALYGVVPSGYANGDTASLLFKATINSISIDAWILNFTVEFSTLIEGIAPNTAFHATGLTSGQSGNQNADSTPTAFLVHNGVIDSATTVAIANISAGVYDIEATVPTSYNVGDTVNVIFAAVVSGITTFLNALDFRVAGSQAPISSITGFPSGKVFAWLISTDNVGYGNPSTIQGARQNAQAAKNDGIDGFVLDAFADPVGNISNCIIGAAQVSNFLTACGINLEIKQTNGDNESQLIADAIAAVQAYVTLTAPYSSTFKVNGLPVVFIYNPQQYLTASDWAEVVAATSGIAYFVGGFGQMSWSSTPIDVPTALTFGTNWNAWFSFIPPSDVNLGTIVALASSYGKPYFPSVMPQNYGSGGYSQPSDGGVTFARQWTRCITSRAQNVLISTWNDSVDDQSAIVPTYENETIDYIGQYKSGLVPSTNTSTTPVLQQNTRLTPPPAFFGIDWSDLNQVVTRERGISVRTPEGMDQITFSNNPVVAPQLIRSLIYPHVLRSGRGIDRTLPEGVLERTSHIMMCNYVIDDSPNPIATDILLLDRITDQNGVQYRVEGVFDDGGEHHHLLVPLSSIGTEGDA